MSDKLCVVMPVYNERDAIGAVLAKWDDALSVHLVSILGLGKSQVHSDSTKGTPS